MEAYRKTKDDLSEYDRASRESEIWELRLKLVGPGSTEKGPVHRDWMATHFGGSKREYEARAYLFNHKKWTQPLWDLLARSNGMTLCKLRALADGATRLVRTKGISKQEALKRVLNGSTPVNENRVENDAEKSPLTIISIPTTSYGLSKSLRTLVLGYVDLVLSSEGVDHYQAKILRDKFLVSVDEDIAQFLNQLNRLKNSAKEERLVKIGEHKFHSACLTLGITAQWRAPIDPTKLRKIYKQRMSEIHVDRPGNEGNAVEMQEVKEAYDVLSDYVEYVFPRVGLKKFGKSEKKEK
jgi:hypothetical protein